MALQNAGRPATARPVNEPPLSCAEADNAKIALNPNRKPSKKSSRGSGADSSSCTCIILGPSPLGHFIREVEVATGADVTARLETHAKIDPEFVRAPGSDQFAPLVHVIDESGS